MLKTVTSKHNAHAIGCFLISHAQVMIAFDLFQEWSKLFFHELSSRFVRRGIAVATPTRPGPAILCIDGIESDKDCLGYVIQFDLGQDAHRLGDHSGASLASFPMQP